MSEAAAAGAAPDAEAGAFRTGPVLWLIGVAVAAALGFAALAAFAPELRASKDPGAHALSRSAVGYAGLVRLLQETDRPVLVSRDPASHTAHAGRPGLLILAPPPGVAQTKLDALISSADTVLIVAPKWAAGPDALHPGWAVNFGLIPSPMTRTGTRTDLLDVDRAEGTSSPVLRPPGTGSGLFGQGTALYFGPVDQLQSRTKGSARPILVDQGGRAVLLQAHGNVFVLTDPDLLNNHGLASLSTAHAAVALIDALRGGGDNPVVFDVTLNGLSRTRSLWRVALEPPFLAATLCVLAAALLTGWRAAASFGPVERRGRAVALGKRALVDSSAGLIRLTRREPRMAPRYAALIRSQAMASAGAREQAPEAADAYLDRLAEGADRARFSLLAEEAGQAKTQAALMRAAEALYRWKSEVVRERR